MAFLYVFACSRGEILLFNLKNIRRLGTFFAARSVETTLKFISSILYSLIKFFRSQKKFSKY